MTGRIKRDIRTKWLQFRANEVVDVRIEPSGEILAFSTINGVWTTVRPSNIEIHGRAK